jgi:hypothetical protein
MKPQKQFKGSQHKEESQGQKSPGKFKEGDEKHIK